MAECTTWRPERSRRSEPSFSTRTPKELCYRRVALTQMAVQGNRTAPSAP